MGYHVQEKQMKDYLILCWKGRKRQFYTSMWGISAQCVSHPEALGFDFLGTFS